MTLRSKLSKTLLLSTLFLGFASPVAAESINQPMVLYGGASSTSNDRDMLNKIFKSEGQESIQEQVIYGEDMDKYLGTTGARTDNLYSSVYIHKGNQGDGVTVSILTPENITSITANQYRNAAITAGVSATHIDVAATKPVTGESALTGVYKAFDTQGLTLDPDRVQAAQNELETVSSIATNLDPNQSLQLDKVIADIKDQLVQLNAKTDQLATRQDVENIVNTALKTYGLDSLISEEQVSSLVDLAENYQKTKAITDPNTLKALGDLQQDISAKVNETLNGQFGQQIKDFFAAIWQILSEFFSSIFANFNRQNP